MDELGFNKLFAGILVAGLMLMAGVKLAEVMVPHTELTQNSYVIEVPETGAAGAAAPVSKGPEPILALLASADVAAVRSWPRSAQPVTCLMPAVPTRLAQLWEHCKCRQGAVDGFAYSGRWQNSAVPGTMRR